MTTVPTVETEVLIVGSGPAGASAALALSTCGVPNVMVTRHRRETHRDSAAGTGPDCDCSTTGSLCSGSRSERPVGVVGRFGCEEQLIGATAAR